MEVDAAERGEQRTEHHHREHRVDHLAQRIARGIELWHPVKQQIDHRSRGYRHRQRPVLQKLLHIQHIAYKGIKITAEKTDYTGKNKKNCKFSVI